MKNKLIFQAVVAMFFTLVAAPADAYSYNITNLGSFGGTSEALAISDNGHVVGDSFMNPNGDLRAASFIAGGTPSAYATYSISTSFSRAFGVNNNRQSVGLAILSNQFRAAMFSPSGSALDLGTLGGSESQANGINNNGQVVGISSTVNNGWSHATLVGVGSSPIDLGTLSGGTWSNANAINKNGQIVGSSTAFYLNSYGNFFRVPPFLELVLAQ